MSIAIACLNQNKKPALRILFFFLIIPFLGNSQVLTKNAPHLLYEDAGGLFDLEIIRTLSIDFQDSNYHEILVNNWFADNGERLPAKVELSNGEKLENVAIRYKGNSTFYEPNSYHIPKLPFNLDINKLVPGQKLMGSKKLKLANSMFDPTYVKEITGYRIYQNYLPSPEANLMRVEVQGKYLGLYVNTEAIDKTFLKKHYNENDGVLVKCDPVQRYRQPGPRGRSDLSWLGSDTTLYYNHYSLKSDKGWKEFVHLIDIINNHPEQIETVLNVDRTLWALAVNQAVANFDTYNGTDPRNYYMYQTENGLFQMIPWDVSESFISAMLDDLGEPYKMYYFDPFNRAEKFRRPLTTALFNNRKYEKIYAAHLRTIIEESLDTTQILEFIDQVHSIAEEPASSDRYNLWGMKQFHSNVYEDFSAFDNSFAGIIKTIKRRSTYLKNHFEIKKEAPSISNVDVHEWNNLNIVSTNTFNAETAELMISENELHSNFKSYPMEDNGENGDVFAGDGIFTAVIPDSQNGLKTEFYIRAENKNAIQLSPKRAAYEFYIFSPSTIAEQNNEFDEFSIYPNPTKGIVYLKGDFFQLTQFEVYSSVGNLVQSGIINSTNSKIDLTRFSSGIYYLKINNNSYKIVKTK